MFKIESGIAMARAASNKKTPPFTGKLDLRFKKETRTVPYLEHSFVLC